MHMTHLERDLSPVPAELVVLQNTWMNVELLVQTAI